MNELELKELIQAVTAQVLAGLEQRGADGPRCQGLKKVLVIGSGPLPAAMGQGAVALDISDYESHQNILRYDRLVITALTFPQLADIALGRGGDAASEAVLLALLSGIEVYMTEEALPFRAWAGKGSTPLYQLLEGYARTLQVFGVKSVERQYQPAPPPPAKPAKFQAPSVCAPQGTAKPNIGRLITEQDALELVKQGDTVKRGDVIGTAAEGLSVCIHASITGTVTEVTKEYVVICEC